MKKHFVDATTALEGCRHQAKGTAVDDLCPCVCVGCQSCSWANGSYAQPRVDTSCGQAKDNMGHRPSFFFQLPTILISRHSLVFKIELTSLLRMPLRMSSHTRLSQFFLRSRLFFLSTVFHTCPAPASCCPAPLSASWHASAIFRYSVFPPIINFLSILVTFDKLPQK